MQTEIEAKFLDQNHDAIRRKLIELGAVCEHKVQLMRRTVFDYPDRKLSSKRAWVRLREELDGSVELVLKQVVDDKLGQTFEQPLIVNDYESAQQFLISIGLEIKAEQQSKREVWRLDDTEIMLDEWPWVRPFIEIEAPTEHGVRDVADKLSISWEDACFGAVTPVYVAEYDITAEEFDSADISMKFGDPVPVLLGHARKLAT